MPYTRHGHPYGTVDTAEPRPRMVARCGGPRLCAECALDADQRGDPPLHEDDPTRPGNLSAEEYAATYAGGGGGHALPPGLVEAIGRDLDKGGPQSLFTLPYIAAAAHGGPFRVPPCLVVVHAMECPIRAGYARSLAGWFARPPADGGPGTSAHTLTDPAETIETVHAETVAYHVGPPGNPVSRGEEHAGYTAYTREQWTTPDGLAMLRLSAANVAARCAALGVPVRWLSLEQVRQAARTHAPADGGVCTHNDIRLALGGTTHTDPGAGYPYDLYLDLVRQAAGQQQEDDVSYDDAVRALRDVLRLPSNGLAVPRGQVDNGNLASLLVGMAQGDANRDAAEAAKIGALSGTLTQVLQLVQQPDAGPITAEQLQAMLDRAAAAAVDGLQITRAPAPSPTQGG